MPTIPSRRADADAVPPGGGAAGHRARSWTSIGTEDRREVPGLDDTRHFDEIYQRVDKLETEYDMPVAGLKRVEERLDRVEQKVEKVGLRSELDELKARVDVLQEQIRALEGRAERVGAGSTRDVRCRRRPRRRAASRTTSRRVASGMRTYPVQSGDYLRAIEHRVGGDATGVHCVHAGLHGLGEGWRHRARRGRHAARGIPRHRHR